MKRRLVEMELEKCDLLKVAELLNSDPKNLNKNEEKLADTDRATKSPHNPVDKTHSLSCEYAEELETCFGKALPEYEIIYRQTIGTEDAFLGIGNRTPSSLSCEDMVIRIRLPEESYAGISLEVTENNVVIDGNKHNLNLPLPHSIDPEKSNAEWDQDTESLLLKLRIIRQFDAFHF